MERLTDKNLSKACNDPWDYCGLDGICIRDCHKPTPCKIPKMVDRLSAYEDTGLEPEEIKAIHAFFNDRSMEEFEHLHELLEAEKAGRLMVLDEPRKPLVWGDDNRDTVLCPSCEHDLMGGFQEGNSSETPMYQCPYCGQPIDGTKALTREEAEAALAEKGSEG